MATRSSDSLRAAWGVDGCRAGWAVARVGLESGTASQRSPVELRLCSSFREVLDTCQGVVAVDLPIGLADGPRVAHRACDRAARELLGTRRSTVFAPPLRGQLAARAYGPRLRAAGLSVQAFHLLPKLREVDEALGPADQERVFEAHPELAFLRLAREPVSAPKRTAEGRRRRRELLARSRQPSLPGVLDALERFLGETRRGDVAEDDALDALVLARTAWRRDRGLARCLPCEPPRDARGLRMEIWW
jgi:predicted RNase H-like nuclease